MSEQKPRFVYDPFKGTLEPYANFQAEQDAEDLRAAMKGLGTDEDAIIRIVACRTNAQRLNILIAYKKKFGRDLMEDLKKELSGDFEETVVACFYAPIDYDVHCLHKAMCGPGTDEEALIEIIATRSNEEIKLIKEAYKAKYCKDLVDAVKDDTSGNFKRFLVILLQGCREAFRHVDEDLAKKEAEVLYKAGEKFWGTDEEKFNEIMCNRSFPQLRATFYYYQRCAGHSIMKAICKEFSGDMEEGLAAIVEIAFYLPSYFAKRLYRAMCGVGTDDSTLIRVIVSRCEIDLYEIKDEFFKLYKKPLYKWVKEDTSGDYRKMLIELIKD